MKAPMQKNSDPSSSPVKLLRAPRVILQIWYLMQLPAIVILRGSPDPEQLTG
jgi:hypothetical protein